MAANPGSALSPLALIVLALLDEAPMYPYRMQRLIRDRGTDHVVNIRHRASFYQAITRLKRDGLIEVHGTDRTDNRPEHTLYELTAAGRETIHSRLEVMLSTPADEYPEFPAALSFIYLLEPSQARAVLIERAERRATECQQLADVLNSHADSLPRLFLIETEYRRAILDAELTWLRGVISDIEVKRVTWSPAAIRAGNYTADPEEIEQ